MCGKMKFLSKAPMLKYRQKSLNSCYLSSLKEAFDRIKKTKAVNDVAIRIE